MVEITYELSDVSITDDELDVDSTDDELDHIGCELCGTSHDGKEMRYVHPNHREDVLAGDCCCSCHDDD